jgi:hypothetical protein
MKPKDNSDLTLLIYSDYLEETGLIEEAISIREQVKQEQINQFSHEVRNYNVGAGHSYVGFDVNSLNEVGPSRFGGLDYDSVGTTCAHAAMANINNIMPICGFGGGHGISDHYPVIA